MLVFAALGLAATVILGLNCVSRGGVLVAAVASVIAIGISVFLLVQ
jgi:hypothetical protein